jgi:unsaturated rhamnogalacturonyl hydrolase
MAFLKLWEETGQQAYFDYARSYADTMIDENGDIRNYRIDEYNIDHINPGKILFTLYAETEDKRYENALNTLRRQLEWQPRTTEGGYWHKLRYTWQMWLDGLYMGAPFYAEYAERFGEPESFADIAQQFKLIELNNRDHETGLLYHGWDESRVQRWSNPETGCSPHFWGRAMGWYGMALVDVLDHFPEEHPDREELEAYLTRFVEAIAQVQDDETGLWYQVLDMPNREGNYLEATASSMFVYTITKAVNNGLIDNRHIATAQKGFNGLVEHLIDVEDSGEIHLLKCCSVAGLGGSPYRDGSFAYYISEEVRSNDPKGTGPFILAVLELEEYDKHVRR